MHGFFIEYLFSDPWFFLSWSLIIIFSICVHEYAHAYAAVRRGDSAAATHLTLNPMVQMGPLSLAALFLIGFAWGAVPIREGLFWRPRDRAWVSASGPLSNLALCAIFATLAAGAVRSLGAGTPAAFFLSLGAQANGVLFVLNMLPAPMLDGWSVLSAWFPGMEDWRRNQGPWISWAVLFLLFATPLSDGVWIGGRLLADGIFSTVLRLLAS